MAWELSSWLVLTRSFQVMGALAAGGLNGYLVALIYSKHLGLTNAMITLELMVCTVLLREYPPLSPPVYPSLSINITAPHITANWCSNIDPWLLDRESLCVYVCERDTERDC